MKAISNYQAHLGTFGFAWAHQLGKVIQMNVRSKSISFTKLNGYMDPLLGK
jgi:hypothetical protein